MTTKFLFLIQSIEGLHRALDARPGLDPKEFDRGVTAMKAAIPAELSREAQQFLAERVPRHNDPSLRSRLREYGARVTQALPRYSRGSPTIETPSRSFVTNSATHSKATNGALPRSMVGHFYITARCSDFLFEFNLLHHLGIASTQLGVIFKTRFENLVRQRSELIKPNYGIH